jgi:exosome complex RNA-binding protein Rrp4
MEDMVLGVVLEMHVENAKVDLGSAVPAVLPMLAFEGATRKNRPNLQVRSCLCPACCAQGVYEGTLLFHRPAC